MCFNLDFGERIKENYLLKIIISKLRRLAIRLLLINKSFWHLSDVISKSDLII